MLGRLVAKQVVAFNDSELSAERGQYSFLQALLRTIAYGTLSRRDRKARHLAAARHLQQAWGSEAGEIAEVLATHYLDAARAEPDATDAPTIRESALKTLAEAGRRAASLALGRRLSESSTGQPSWPRTMRPVPTSWSSRGRPPGLPEMRMRRGSGWTPRSSCSMPVGAPTRQHGPPRPSPTCWR